MAKHLVVSVGAFATLGSISAPVAAQFDPQAAAHRAIGRACSERAGQVISPERLEQALRLETISGLPGDSLSIHEQNLLQGVRRLLLQDLALPGTAAAKALLVSPAPPESGVTSLDWLFTGPFRYTLTCAAKTPPANPQFTKLPQFTVRKSASELAKIGKERRAAGSAQGAYDSTRVTDLKGDTKRTRKLVLNASMGVALGGTEDRYAIGFGEYSRSSARIKTEPTPVDPAKNGSADDINALELGILGTSRIHGLARATGRLGYIMDFETRARFISGGLTLTPITGGGIHLGLCNLGSYRYVGFGIDVMCVAALEADIRYVGRKGEAEVSAKDYIVAAGPVVGLSFRRTLDINGKPQDGFVGSAVYRYLPVFTGSAPDLKRFDTSLAYRWWAGDLGFDIGATFADGIERKSLGDERRFSLLFGLIY